MDVSSREIELEERLLKNPQQIRLWVYLLEIKRASDVSHAQRFLIYRRALNALPYSYKLWWRYLEERTNHCKKKPLQHKAWHITLTAFEDALKTMSKMPMVWQKYFSFLQSQNLITATRKCFNRALQNLPLSQHHMIWPKYLKFASWTRIPETLSTIYQRYLKTHPEAIEDFIDKLIAVNASGKAALLLVQTMSDDRNAFRKWKLFSALVQNNPEEVSQVVHVEKIFRWALDRFPIDFGRIWCELAEYFSLMGQFEDSIRIYEEALESIMSAKDFAIVFGSYAKFQEKMIELSMKAETDGNSVDEMMNNLEAFIGNREMMLNSVMLRKNPNSVKEWRKRIQLCKANHPPEFLVKVYSEALSLIDPSEAVEGSLASLWIEFSIFYEKYGDFVNARNVIEKALTAELTSTKDYADLWNARAEIDIRDDKPEKALQVLSKALKVPPKNASSVRRGVHKSTQLWSLRLELEEIVGTFESTKAAYDATFSTKVVTPDFVLRYVCFLTSLHRYEESFRVFEKALSLFMYPHNVPLWNQYIDTFVSFYNGSKLERARDLIESALKSVPKDSKEKKEFYLKYVQVEQRFGLVHRILHLFDAACEDVRVQDRFEMFMRYLEYAKTRDAETVRSVYEKAIQSLEGNALLKISIDFAEMEAGMGEIDRARAIYGFAGNYADPLKETVFWMKWKQFEVSFGTEETFREMLRLKRSLEGMASSGFVAEIDEDEAVIEQVEERDVPSAVFEHVQEKSIGALERLKSHKL